MSKLNDDEFAKIFNVNGTQLLVYWSPEGEDGFTVNQIFQCGLGEVNMSLSFETEEATAKVFNRYDQEMAEKLYEKYSQYIDSLTR